MISSPILQSFVDDKDIQLLYGFKGLKYVETITGCAFFNLQIHSGLWSTWDKLLKNELAKVRFRWGMDVEGGERVWSDWKHVYFSSMKMNYYRGHVEAEVSGVDQGWDLIRNIWSKAYTNVKVSSVVEYIAERYGLYSDVEETQGDIYLHQCNRSDFDFIVDELLPRAKSTSGRVDYTFFIRNGNVLVFRPLDFSKTSDFSLRFGPDLKDNEVDFPYVHVENRYMFLTEEGGINTKYVGFDPMKQEPVSFVANDYSVEYDRLEKSLPEYSGISKCVILSEPDPGDNYNPVQVYDEGKSRWSRNFRSRFRLKIIGTPRLDAVPGQIIRLDMTTVEGEDHILSGKYILYGVETRISVSTIQTIFYLERRTTR